MFEPRHFLDLTHTRHGSLFAADEPVWSALPKIEPYLRAHLQPRNLGTVHATATIGKTVFIDEGTVVEAGAHIKGPAWIGKNCTVRSGCYVRENVITGAGCVLGNSSEFKNCILFDGCEVPHFNYVGDAILGHKAHLGAGVILSNVRLDRTEVTVRGTAENSATGLRKFSAVIGDFSEIGCNSVLSPGTVIGRHCILYPLANFSGVLPEKHNPQSAPNAAANRTAGVSALFVFRARFRSAASYLLTSFRFLATIAAMSAILDLPEVRERVMRWSVKDYERFTEMGVFRKNVELIHGIIVEKISKSPLHITLSTLLHQWLLALLPPGFCIRYEAPLRFHDSEPEPDIAIVRGSVTDYGRGHPSTAALVIEVAVSSVALDRENASLYAEAGVEEYWIVLPALRQVEMYRQPQNGAYAVKLICEAPATLDCTSVAQVRVDLAALFGAV